MAKKERADVLLVQRGLIDTREKAKRAIMAGQVYTLHERIDKPGTKIEIDSDLHIKGETLRYVGRGGLKLEKAISEFELNLEDRTVIDIGSSTGGFTDCALQNGAKLVYAVDVGYNQLAWKLRQDPRVVVMERTNFRYVTSEDLKQDQPDFATIDVSFISLRLILPVLKTVLASKGEVVALVKPQFEAGKEDVGKKGIVKDPRIHRRVLEEMVEFAKKQSYKVKSLSFSPITGGEGNIEFLLYLQWDGEDETTETDSINVEEVVQNAHENFKG
ncbi:TlyA family RNA methyltransferase [Pseudalkalibacillus caeni]|uniref:TlyA family RNA methyltransferase n=1 Tax=Exobacillus caeni TaxID=2574798 RepID=A0A5R9F029_9BACL|nr:TlyA family RNA methyltransferase [Pseudalkalibacillus caeni]TLS36381.1 TlyA family RNA methyltransferase [Pseudalkalibacillus caeni]